jgi:uncharacterized protein (TIGR04255 family)
MTKPLANPVDFERPPIAEVALAVQFAGPVMNESQTLGRFWPKVQSRFPIIETQLPLPPMMEEFGVSMQPQFLFQMGPAGQRYWMQTENRSGLVQVQPDRMAYNWRKDPGDFPYPRYEQLRDEFCTVYEAFLETCREQGREPEPTWCEISYINPIEVGDERDLAGILLRLAPSTLSLLGQPEDTTLNERFVLSRDGQPYGRFYATAAPAIGIEDNAQLVVLTLVARGLATSPDLSGILTFLDEGRNLIVNTFRDMTTETMHRRWGLQ